MKRKALAQIPLILGLLVMAIAIPVATKLVQENQDSRRGAASCSNGSCQLEGMSKCTNNQQYFCDGSCWVWVKKCSNGCGATTCRSAAPPTATATPKPKATATPKPKATATPTLTCKVNGAYCGVNDVCCSKKCSDGKCVVNSSVTPTCNDPCDVGDTGAIRCKSNKQQRCENRCWTFMKDCPNGCDGNYCRVTPTKVPTVTPTKTPIIPTGTVPIVTTTPVPSDKCPGAQACPDSTGKILRDCVKPDNDGTSRDSICAVAGEKDTCGGKDYCCPTAGGKWTTDMTKCPAANCTQCTNDPGAKGKGDADCSRFTNLTDYLIWKEEYIAGDLGASVKNTWRADFNCDGKVDLVNDYLIWKNYYITTLQ